MRPSRHPEMVPAFVPPAVRAFVSSCNLPSTQNDYAEILSRVSIQPACMTSVQRAALRSHAAIFSSFRTGLQLPRQEWDAFLASIPPGNPPATSASQSSSQPAEALIASRGGFSPARGAREASMRSDAPLRVPELPGLSLVPDLVRHMRIHLCPPVPAQAPHLMGGDPATPGGLDTAGTTAVENGVVTAEGGDRVAGGERTGTGRRTGVEGADEARCHDGVGVAMGTAYVAEQGASEGNPAVAALPIAGERPSTPLTTHAPALGGRAEGSRLARCDDQRGEASGGHQGYEGDDQRGEASGGHQGYEGDDQRGEASGGHQGYEGDDQRGEASGGHQGYEGSTGYQWMQSCHIVQPEVPQEEWLDIWQWLERRGSSAAVALANNVAVTPTVVGGNDVVRSPLSGSVAAREWGGALGALMDIVNMATVQAGICSPLCGGAEGVPAPAPLLGRRVEADFTHHGLHSGELVRYDPEKFSYIVRYDDGEEEEVVLPDPTVTVQGAPLPSSPHSRSAQATVNLANWLPPGAVRSGDNAVGNARWQAFQEALVLAESAEQVAAQLRWLETEILIMSAGWRESRREGARARGGAVCRSEWLATLAEVRSSAVVGECEAAAEERRAECLLRLVLQLKKGVAKEMVTHLWELWEHESVEACHLAVREFYGRGGAPPPAGPRGKPSAFRGGKLVAELRRAGVVASTAEGDASVTIECGTMTGKLDLVEGHFHGCAAGAASGALALYELVDKTLPRRRLPEGKGEIGRVEQEEGAGTSGVPTAPGQEAQAVAALELAVAKLPAAASTGGAGTEQRGGGGAGGRLVEVTVAHQGAGQRQGQKMQSLNRKQAVAGARQRGRPRKKPVASSRYCGVSWSKGQGRWLAQLHSYAQPRVQVGDGVARRYWAAYFDDEGEAARQYDRVARLTLGAAAHLNFPGAVEAEEAEGAVRTEESTEAGEAGEAAAEATESHKRGGGNTASDTARPAKRMRQAAAARVTTAAATPEAVAGARAVAAASRQGGTPRKKSGVSSRYRGVSWSKGQGRWFAQLHSKGGPWAQPRVQVGDGVARRYWGAYFDDEGEAARQYDRVARLTLGAAAHLNFPGTAEAEEAEGAVRTEESTEAGEAGEAAAEATESHNRGGGNTASDTARPAKRMQQAAAARVTTAAATPEAVAGARAVAAASRQRGRPRKQSGASSRYRGVSWSKGQGRWLAQFSSIRGVQAQPRVQVRDGVARRCWTAFFDDEGEAARQYDRVARLTLGAAAHLNFPGTAEAEEAEGAVRIEESTEAGEAGEAAAEATESHKRGGGNTASDTARPAKRMRQAAAARVTTAAATPEAASTGGRHTGRMSKQVSESPSKLSGVQPCFRAVVAAPEAGEAAGTAQCHSRRTSEGLLEPKPEPASVELCALDRCRIDDTRRSADGGVRCHKGERAEGAPAPADLVGCLVACYWDTYACWFLAHVEAYLPQKKMHQVCYHDEEREKIELPDETVLFVEEMPSAADLTLEGRAVLVHTCDVDWCSGTILKRIPASDSEGDHTFRIRYRDADKGIRTRLFRLSEYSSARDAPVGSWVVTRRTADGS
ncbi:hypothetical protein CYMTET_48384 [Cymbomonas tetramitiformis]|uniref:AP2/ERF domain-containing protein n=1 Tax=Cymbomonas tetramitiformis TaxID=36881 RepID=A0AAE0EVN1_9CHLO|nr:hypothetical protein CYMTET_48384 [Cymbomonas tetramitiformis]